MLFPYIARPSPLAPGDRVTGTTSSVVVCCDLAFFFLRDPNGKRMTRFVALDKVEVRDDEVTGAGSCLVVDEV